MSYICERCGKLVEDADKFGSGRFCSRACANTRNHSVETKERIRKGINKETKCFCQYCGKEFTTLTAKASHERLCSLNPDKAVNPSIYCKESKKERNVVIYTSPKIVLDITYGELDTYRQEHPVCEICGRSIDDAVKWNSKFAAKNLCVDHDHSTGKFRGLLCQVCNRQLGWYEKNKEKINNYLGK